MPEYLSISKQTPQFPAYLDFQVLRDIGIQHLNALSGALWTDYNLHDPGVTILEVLCYAITDLGYRNNFDIQDLLALNPGKRNNQEKKLDSGDSNSRENKLDPENSKSRENNFFTPDQVLTCNPVTILDLRKRLIDIQGVRNVIFEKVGIRNPQTKQIDTSYTPAIYVDVVDNRLRYPPLDPSDLQASRLHPKGLYTVCLDLDSQYRRNACGQLYRDWSDTLEAVQATLCRYRNLCEDVYDIIILGEEEIGLCADLQIEATADAEDVLVEVYGRVQEFLAPRLQFYTLQELLAKGKSPAEIFAGRPIALDHSPKPYKEPGYDSHGFIDTDELDALTPRTILHTSDLYQEILKVPGVVAVKKLIISNYINDIRQSPGHPWYLHLTERHRPVLGIQQSKINVLLGELPIPVDEQEVERRYYEQQSISIKTPRDPYELNLTVPKGKYYDLSDHYSIHHDFPLNYGISEEGLPETVSAFRKAQAQQLKAYLVFFDQLLAGYLSQLSHLRDLFSWEIDAASDQEGTEQNGYALRPKNRQRTYFNQVLDFPGVKEIIQGLNESEYLDAIAETTEVYRDRRNRFLDHLLARFAESFTDYVLLNYRMFSSNRDCDQYETGVIRDKARFLQEYPTLSHDRFRAFNYCDCDAVWDTDNVSGFKRRVSRLLGIQDARRRNLNHYQVNEDLNRVVLSVNCSPDHPPLISRQTYQDEETALAELEQFLQFTLHAEFYKPLTYSSFYHYGWEVRFTHNEQPISLRYERYFPSRVERWNALEPLLNELGQRLAEFNPTEPPTTEESRSPTELIQIELDAEGFFYFRLDIPPITPADGTIITFTVAQRYSSRDQALAAGIASLAAIQVRSNYCKVFLQTANATEQEPGTAQNIPYYSYALTDPDHQGLAISSQRFLQADDRDTDLQRWLCHIQANQNQFHFAVEQTSDQQWIVLLKENANPRILLRSVIPYETKDGAWQAATLAAVRLRSLRAYISPAIANNQRYSLGLTDPNNQLLMVADTGCDRLTTFQQLNSLEPFLVFEQVNATGNQSAGVRFRLGDRLGHPLLQGVQTYPDRTTARDRFNLEVLGILFEPGVIYPTSSPEGFSFRILGRPRDQRSTAAIHPHFYATEAERDGAIERLLLLVRTARFRVRAEVPGPPSPAYRGQLYDGQNHLLLQGSTPYPQPDDAWTQGNTLMELAQNRENYRLIDSKDGPFGWELTNEEKDQVLAAQYYPDQAKREEAIAQVQQWVNDEGFHVLEHILLRPRTKLPLTETGEVAPNVDGFLPIFMKPEDLTVSEDDPSRLTRQDPYSFWVSVILPYWPERFRNINFRRFIEQTLRLEAPAHVALRIAWIDLKQMHDLDKAYHDWLDQLTQFTCYGSACDLTGTLNRLLELLPQLRSVYPQATLHNCEESTSKDRPILLNQTALGTAQD